MDEMEKKGFGQKLKDIFIPAKGDTQRQRLSKIIALIAVALIIAALVMGILIIRKYVVKDQILDADRDLYPSSTPISSQQSSGTSSEAEPVWEAAPFVPDPETGLDADFTELYETNSDIFGYIKIEGTALDMPVVKGDNNAFYLDHTLRKEYNAFGIPFADYRVTLTESYQSDNITIYGHASQDGTFFAPVKQYKDTTLEFYKKHPTVTLNTIYGKGEYKIIAVMLVNTDVKSSELFNFHDYIDMNESTFNSFLEKVRAHSYFENPDVDVEYGDKLITLSTCDDEIVKSNTMPYRVALVARKIRDGEKLAVDVEKVVPNEDVIMPAAWVKKFGVQTPFEKE